MLFLWRYNYRPAFLDTAHLFSVDGFSARNHHHHHHHPLSSVSFTRRHRLLTGPRRAISLDCRRISWQPPKIATTALARLPLCAATGQSDHQMRPKRPRHERARLRQFWWLFATICIAAQSLIWCTLVNVCRIRARNIEISDSVSALCSDSVKFQKFSGVSSSTPCSHVPAPAASWNYTRLNFNNTTVHSIKVTWKTGLSSALTTVFSPVLTPDRTRHRGVHNFTPLFISMTWRPAHQL